MTRLLPFKALNALTTTSRQVLPIIATASFRRHKGSIAEADSSHPTKETRQSDFLSRGLNPYPRLTRPPADEPLLTVKEVVGRWEAALDKGGRVAEQTITVTGEMLSSSQKSIDWQPVSTHSHMGMALTCYHRLIFYDIVQDGHTVQAVASRNNFIGTDEEFALANKQLYRGDIIATSGVPGKTNIGQMSVFITRRLELLSPCLHNIPRAGLKESAKRFRNRHLDLLVNQDPIHILKTRTKVIKFIRHYLDSHDFLEVETPVLSVLAGGANARPFLTHANAMGIDMYLRIAPELYLKQLVIGGLDRVYELGKQFRNEGVDADHNPEFTTCEFYQAYGNLETLIDITEGMVADMVHTVTGSYEVPFSHPGSDPVILNFSGPFRRLDVVDELERKLGQPLPNLDKTESVDPLMALCHAHHVYVPEPHTVSRIVDKLISHFVEPECVQPTLLMGHPVVMSPLAKAIKDDKGRTVAGRFELFVAGKEIVNAYEELNDPEEQRARFAKQQEDRDLGDPEAQMPDHLFCDALEFGLPPTAGWGMGVDRVVALLTGAHHIREVLAFPVMKPVQP
ncbi:lysyl-tRNA synthetase-like protein [Jimgerdemannia flammicorona]|uniref:Probable lysine--tRNA ligase, cytoplasmic n=1 Tax=Jimgerdemannia flammicorona TaxID=994334 RepID=A0A433D862_9FUNG|nr:lysyl-tRNA synthetase-like protein [Jimgerdemannia flammicorona]